MKKTYEDRRDEYEEFFPVVNFCEQMNLLMAGKIRKIDNYELDDFNSIFEKTEKHYDYIIKNLNQITEYKYLKKILDTILEMESVTYYKKEPKGIEFRDRKRFTFVHFIDCVVPDKRVEFLKKYLLECIDTSDFEHVLFDKFQQEKTKDKKHRFAKYPIYYDTLKEITFTKEEVLKKLKHSVIEFPNLIYLNKKYCKDIAASIGITFNEFEKFIDSNLNKKYM